MPARLSLNANSIQRVHGSKMLESLSRSNELSKLSWRTWGIFAVERSEEHWRLFAWMSREDFGLLSKSDQSKRFIAELVQRFELPGSSDSMREAFRTKKGSGNSGTFLSQQ